MPVIAAVPNDLAGFILEPVNVTTAKWPTVTARPIANGAINLESGLFASQTPNTVNIRINPRKNSNPKPCNGKIVSDNDVLPKLPSIDSGRSAWK